jgi:hypothetical protein
MIGCFAFRTPKVIDNILNGGTLRMLCVWRGMAECAIVLPGARVVSDDTQRARTPQTHADRQKMRAYEPALTAE